MCGVAGAILPEGSQQAVEKMVARLHHRGPDDRGVEIITPDGRVCLGSTRLAIIDPSISGHMPMRDRETGNWITYNGEVYNFLEIRAELESTGVVFESGTDTEVVLKSYGRWGPSALDRMRGMFAFAIWDQRRQSLFIARDRLGLKPLYFWNGPDGFLFASEVRALLASDAVGRVLDRQGLECLLANGFMISPLTLIDGVRSLLPGHSAYVDVERGMSEPTPYWNLVAASGEQSATTLDLRETLSESVRLRMISDVPLGAFLSGGLDSSSIVGLMSEHGDRVHTFTISFDEDGFDESVYSRRVADHFSTLHTEERLTRDTFLTWLPDALAALDQPSFDGINTYCVSRAAKESGLTVALSGLGADELFGGYRFFRTAPHIARARHIPRTVRRIVQALSYRAFNETLRGVSGGAKAIEALWTPGPADEKHVQIGAYQAINSVFPRWARDVLRGRSEPGFEKTLVHGLPVEFVRFLRRHETDGDEFAMISMLALRIFMGERTLRDTDAMSMALSLEVRAPFTDHEFIRRVLSVPGRVRCSGAPNKPFQWDLVRPILGDDLKRDRKWGFSIPFSRWLSDDVVVEELEKVFLNHRLQERLALKPHGVSSVLKAHVDSPARMPWSRVWTLFVLLKYCELHEIQAG